MPEEHKENSDGYEQSGGESGYGGTAGFGALPGYQGNGYASSKLESPGYAANPNYYGESEAAALGALNNPLVTERIENPYSENVFEFNPFDTAYTETLSNSNPQGSGYGHSSRTDEDQPQLEL